MRRVSGPGTNPPHDCRGVAPGPFHTPGRLSILWPMTPRNRAIQGPDGKMSRFLLDCQSRLAEGYRQLAAPAVLWPDLSRDGRGS